MHSTRLGEDDTKSLKQLNFQARLLACLCSMCVLHCEGCKERRLNFGGVITTWLKEWWSSGLRTVHLLDVANRSPPHLSAATYLLQTGDFLSVAIY